MRFCVDCRFIEDGNTCAASLDPVTGAQTHHRCEDERSAVLVWAQCGLEGKNFKERSEQEREIIRNGPTKLTGAPFDYGDISHGTRIDMKRGRSDDGDDGGASDDHPHG